MDKNLTILQHFSIEEKDVIRNSTRNPVQWNSKKEYKTIYPKREQLSEKKCPECNNKIEIVSTEEIDFVWHCTFCKSYFEMG